MSCGLPFRRAAIRGLGAARSPHYQTEGAWTRWKEAVTVRIVLQYDAIAAVEGAFDAFARELWTHREFAVVRRVATKALAVRVDTTVEKPNFVSDATGSERQRRAGLGSPSVTALIETRSSAAKAVAIRTKRCMGVEGGAQGQRVV